MDSIIQEDTSEFIYPTESSTTFKGLTVIWPDKNTLTHDEQTLVAGLYNWWIPKSLELLEESYGISFEYSNPSVKTMTIAFDYEIDIDGIIVSYYKTTNGVQKTTSIEFHIGMKK